MVPIIDPMEPTGSYPNEVTVGAEVSQRRSIVVARPASLGVVLGVLTIDALVCYDQVAVGRGGLPASPADQLKKVEIAGFVLIAEDMAQRFGEIITQSIGLKDGVRY